MGKTILVSAATVVLTVVLLIGIAYTANIFQVDQNGTVRLVVSDTGNVGIGTTSPGAKLSVSNNSGRQLGLTTWADLSAQSSGYGLFAGNAYVTYDGTTNFKYANTHNLIGAIGFAVNYPVWNKASVISSGTTISTADATFTPSVIATFTYDGKVGIGATNPTAKLQVTGLSEYADNAAAIAAGLTAGAFYRTGDLLKVVH